MAASSRSFRRRAALTSLVLALVASTIVPGTAEARRPGNLPKPDLTSKVLERTATKTRIGDTFLVKAEVRRVSMHSKPAGSTTTKIWVSTNKKVDRTDKLAGTINMGSLAVYGSRTGSRAFTWPNTGTGTRYVIACADSAGVVAETDESNNCAWYKVTVSPAPPVVPVVTVGAARPAVEGGPGTETPLDVEVVLDRATTVPVTLRAMATTATGQTATMEQDYRVAVPEVVVPPGQTRVTMRITVLGDAITEDDETMMFNVFQVLNATLGENHTVNTTITDDDAGAVTAQKSSATTVTLSFSGEVTNLAASGSQFTIPGHTVTAASRSKQDVTLTVTPAWTVGATYSVTISPDLRIGSRTVPGSVDFVA